MGQPTPRQSQVATSAASADLDNNQTDEDLVALKEPPTTAEKKQINYGDRLFIHYTHEKRFHSVKRDMHEVYGRAFRNTPAMDLTLVVGNRNRRDARTELIRKRPQQSLLRNKQRKSK